MLELATSWKERDRLELKARIAGKMNRENENRQAQLTNLRVLCIAEQRETVVNLFHFDCDGGARLMITA